MKKSLKLAVFLLPLWSYAFDGYPGLKSDPSTRAEWFKMCESGPDAEPHSECAAIWQGFISSDEEYMREAHCVFEIDLDGVTRPYCQIVETSSRENTGIDVCDPRHFELEENLAVNNQDCAEREIE